MPATISKPCKPWVAIRAGKQPQTLNPKPCRFWGVRLRAEIQKTSVQGRSSRKSCAAECGSTAQSKAWELYRAVHWLAAATILSSDPVATSRDPDLTVTVRLRLASKLKPFGSQQPPLLSHGLQPQPSYPTTLNPKPYNPKA